MKKKVIIAVSVCLLILVSVLCYLWIRKAGKKNTDVVQTSQAVPGDTDARNLNDDPLKTEGQSIDAGQHNIEDVPSDETSTETDLSQDTSVSENQQEESSSDGKRPTDKETEPGEYVIDDGQPSNTEPGKENRPGPSSSTDKDPGKTDPAKPSENHPEETKKQTLYTGDMAGEEDTGF